MAMVSGFDLWESFYNEFRLDWAVAAGFADRVKSVFCEGAALPHVVYYSPLTGLNLSPLVPSRVLDEDDRDRLMMIFSNRYSSSYVSWRFGVSLDASVQSLYYYKKMYDELLQDMAGDDYSPLITLADWLSTAADVELHNNPFDSEFYWVVRSDELTMSNFLREDIFCDVPYFYIVIPPADFRAFLGLMGFSESECAEILERVDFSFDGLRLQSVLFALVEDWNRFVVESLPKVDCLTHWLSESYWSGISSDLPFRLDRVLVMNGLDLSDHYLFGFVYRGMCYVPIGPVNRREGIELVGDIAEDDLWLSWWRSAFDLFEKWVVRSHEGMVEDCAKGEQFSVLLRAEELGVNVLAFTLPVWGLGYVPQVGWHSCFYDGDDGLFLYSFVVVPEWHSLPPVMQVLRDRERVEWSGQLDFGV